MSKLAQGHLDLHSSRSQLDLSAMAVWVEALGGDPEALTGLKSGGEVLAHYPDLPLGQLVAERAHAQCKRLLDAEVQVSRAYVFWSMRLTPSRGPCRPMHRRPQKP